MESPADFIHAIQTALESSDRETAQQLSIQAVKHYPQHEEILKYAHILAPPKVTVEKRLPDRDPEVNQDWIKQNRTQYRGQWVALRNGQLLASASSIDRLVEQLSDKKGVFLTRVLG
jgi:hypothetical protein